MVLHTRKCLEDHGLEIPEEGVAKEPVLVVLAHLCRQPRIKDVGILKTVDELLVFGQPRFWIPGVTLASSLPQIVQEGSPKLQW